MIKTLKWSFIIFAIIIFIAIFASNKEKTRSISEPSKDSHQGGYVLKPNEAKFLDFLFKDEISSFTDNSTSLLKNELLSTSAIGVEKAYNENQVAADQKYFNKTLFLTGRIASINSGLGNKPYVLLQGRNPFMSPQVHFTEDDIKKISALKKGQKLELVCKGAGAVAGIPIFKNCQFTNDYAHERISQLKSEVSDFLKGEKQKSKIPAAIAIMSITEASVLPNESTCFTDGSKCRTEMRNIKKNIFKQKMGDVIAELKSLGIQVPDLTNIQDT